MNIVHPKIKSAVDLIEYLGLKDYKYGGSSAEEIITSVWSFTEKIWENVDLDNYTNHDLNHSLFIIDYFIKLEPLYKWSKYEKTVFVFAALIHDIGMQYNKWAQKGIEEKGFPPPGLSQDEIRKLHTEIGYKLIEMQLLGNYKFKFPPPVADITKTGIEQLISRGAIIAYAHSGDKYWNVLKKPKNKSTFKSRFEDDAPGQESYRPILLAGSLKLCDEFDGNEKRILTPEKINLWNLNDIAKIHWLSCLFIENVVLKVDDDIVDLTIDWQIPNDFNLDLQELVRDLLFNMRVTKIKNEVKKVEEFYKDCDELKLIKQYRINKLGENPSTMMRKIDTETKNLLKSLNLYSDSGPLVTTNTAKGDEFEFTVNKEVIEYYGSDTVLKERLINWFKRNREKGHYILMNKEHTNFYVNCRTLVSDPVLLRGITNEFFSQCKDLGINKILAVGTSAIPLAINLANRLKCGVTFTVSRNKTIQKNPIDKQEKDEYLPLEIEPSLSENENILIIDDIISSGKVAREILDLIFENTSSKLGKIYHYSIFSLGKRDVKMETIDSRISGLWYLVNIKNVIYASDEATCPMCKNSEPKTSEEKMY